MGMAMRMSVRVKVMRRNAEAAIPHATIVGPPAEGVGPLIRTAVVSPHQTHRYGADRRGAHHGQNDAARAFHGEVPSAKGLFADSQQFPSAGAGQARESRSTHGIVRQSARAGPIEDAHSVALPVCHHVYANSTEAGARWPGRSELLRKQFYQGR